MPNNIKFLFSIIFIFFAVSAKAFSHENHEHRQDPPKEVLLIALPDLSDINDKSRNTFERLSSFLKEYWQIWSIDHKQAVEFVYLHNAEAQKELALKHIDVIAIAVIDSPNTNALLSIPYAKFKQKIFRRLASDKNNGTQIGIHSNNEATLNFLSDPIVRNYYQDLDELLENHEKFDALYSTKPWLLTRKLEENDLLKKFYVSNEDAPEVYLHFATRKSDRRLLGEINNSIREVNQLQAQLWRDKYLSKSINMSLTLGNYLTHLSSQEKDFIIDNNLLTYPVTHQGLPPYIITKTFSHLTERGLAIDVTEAITEKTGLLFKPVYINNNAEALQTLISRENDVMILAEPYGNSANNISYSNPYIKYRYNLIHRIDSPSHSDFYQLKNTTIALVASHHASSLIKQHLPNIKVVKVSSIKDALISVATGKADAFIGSPLVSGFIIKQLQLANLTSNPLTNFPAPGDLSFATLKNNTSLTTLLNRSISSISANTFDDIYARWSKTAFTEVSNKEQVANAYRNMGLALATMLLIGLIVFWIYYRELQVRKASQKKVEQALRIAEAAREEAEHSAQAKVIFLARMSHEIRTPMNGVLGMAEALAFTELNPNQQELLDTLKGSARNLLALLNDVLDFSKMDAGKLTLESVPVNICSLSKGIISGFKHMQIESDKAKKEDIMIELNIDETITHQYFTDPTRITQVLNNLLSNAVKFTEQGKVVVNIALTESTTVKNEIFDTLHFSVRDSGIGIAKEKQGLLFTPFIQADNDISRKYGGTGLGLSICQEIIRSMGGEILLESTEEHGSLFHFLLQFKRAGIESHLNERRKNPRLVNPDNDQRFNDFRVLVAEDNLVNVLVITAQLERLNIKADIAENGQIALQMHRKEPYDIVISDCHMPELDGFELAKILRNENSQQPLWLIAITADALSGAAEKCFQAGFDDYMAKPCPQEEVTNKLNNAYRQLIAIKKSTTIE